MFKWSNFSGSLLVRSVYLITVPIVLVQIIGIIIFFELHWDLAWTPQPRLQGPGR